MATRATRPIVRPTAPPVLSPPLPLLLLVSEVDAVLLWLDGGDVGVYVTVLTCPVTVSTERTGVGVHVSVEELDVTDELVVTCESSQYLVQGTALW